MAEQKPPTKKASPSLEVWILFKQNNEWWTVVYSFQELLQRTKKTNQTGWYAYCPSRLRIRTAEGQEWYVSDEQLEQVRDLTPQSFKHFIVKRRGS